MQAEKKSVSRKLGATSLVITLLILVQKVIGLLRESLLANFYGTSEVMDAFLMSESVSIIVMGLIFHFSSPFTPVYAEIIERENRALAKRYQDAIFSFILLSGLLIGVLADLFAEPLLHLIAPGYTGEVFGRTLDYFRWSVWSRVFFALGSLLVAYLHYHGYFLITRVCYLLISITEIITILASLSVGSIFLRYTLTLGNGVFFLCLLIACRKCGYTPRMNLQYTPHVRKTFFMVLPGLLSLALSYINTIIDKNFASSLPTGTVSAFSYANVIYESIYLLISTATTTIATPRISKYVARNDQEALCGEVKNALLNTLTFMIPVVLGSVVLRREIVSLLYERGVFDAAATAKTSIIFAIYSFLCCSRIINVILSHVVYSHGRAAVLTLVGMLSVAVNIALNILLMPVLAHVGLAIATVVSSWAIVPMYILLNKKYLKGFPVREMLQNCLKCLVSALAMAVAVWGVKQVIAVSANAGTMEKGAKMLVYLGLGVGVYGCGVCLLKVEGASRYVHAIKGKLGALLGKNEGGRQ